jgi:hypothetical protein
MRKKTYSEEEKNASETYTRLKSKVDYDLEQHWSREDFIKWYVNKPQKCCYCQCTKEQLAKFYKLTNSKRYNTRGKTLEIERREDKEYSRDNCDFACYWCNNAKSDVFSSEEFNKIGEAIGSVIKEKINL